MRTRKLARRVGLLVATVAFGVGAVLGFSVAAAAPGGDDAATVTASSGDEQSPDDYTWN